MCPVRVAVGSPPWAGIAQARDAEVELLKVPGISSTPDGAWTAQVAQNLTDDVAGPLRSCAHLIVDRDPLHTSQFRSLLASAKVGLLRLPANSPNLNACAERFVRSIKHECLRHIVPLGERHLRQVISAYVTRYHA